MADIKKIQSDLDKMKSINQPSLPIQIKIHYYEQIIKREPNGQQTNGK